MRRANASELLLSIDRGASASIHGQLEEQLRASIRAGRLRPGTVLPSSRTLAGELRVGRNAVAEAYAQLQAEGYLSARRGSGTRVAAGAMQPTPEPEPRPQAATIRLDFRPGVPDLTSFPRSAWGRSARRSLATASARAFGYGDPRGELALREALAAYLGRTRGVAADPGRILICAGLVQGAALVCAVLRALGARRVAVEDPGWSPLRAAVRRAGLEVVPVDVDAAGIDVDALERLSPDAVMVAPAHQYPTGSVLAPERRAALLAWADDRDALIFEDDYDAEFRYDRQPVGSLQGLGPEHVIYGGSASKTLAPGLRIGWLVAPSRVLTPLATAKRRADMGSPALPQLALADFLEHGELDRHLRHMRRRYRLRRDALIAALRRELPQARVLGEAAAGLHVAALLPDGADEAALLAAAREHGVALHGLARERVAPGPPGVIIGFGNADGAQLGEGVRLLAGLL